MIEAFLMALISQCSCTNQAVMVIELFQGTNCEYRILARAVPGSFIPRVNLNKNPPEIQVPAEGGAGALEVMINGAQISWPSTTNCMYEVQQNDDLTTTNWTIVGNYLGMPNKTIIDVPTWQSDHRFYRVRTLCP